MKFAVTGATGTIGRAVVRALYDRGDDVVALSRSADRASSLLGGGVEAFTWEPVEEPAPFEAFDGCDGVVHLLGEPIAQRWTSGAKKRIVESREIGTRNLVEGLRKSGPRMRVLVSQSAVGWYGPHGDERLDETAPSGEGFEAEVVAAWEREATAAEEIGLRVVITRTGVVLSREGGALERMLPPFKLGIGGPVGGGRQYVSWVHLDDVVGAILFCLDNDEASGPINVTAPEPATNRELSKALGRVLHRPAVVPVPGPALRLLYGGMASVVTTGARVLPRRLEELGYEFRRPELEAALAASVR
ncbi:MAG: TIGR01777 family oxidoreductase [Thermoleophilaceae bacterium]